MTAQIVVIQKHARALSPDLSACAAGSVSHAAPRQSPSPAHQPTPRAPSDVRNMAGQGASVTGNGSQNITGTPQ